MARRVIYLALVHYPVLNWKEETIASAVTNLDIHDIARVARTYGAARYYLVTPVAEQQALVRALLDHWTSGVGAQLNPDRREALSLVRLADDLETVKREIAGETGDVPLVVATTAKRLSGAVSWNELCSRMKTDPDADVLLIFGTASGLDSGILGASDMVLFPIEGSAKSGYNHLSVRSAVSIALDRLCGKRE